MDHPFPPEAFQREDESDDKLFYSSPRKLVHIDEPAIAVVGEFFEAVFPQNCVFLDLMSSWRSHLPKGFVKQKMVGLGLNLEEMADNPDLDEHLVHDLNVDPRLPFADNVFDAAVVTVSIQYLTRPIEVFREVNRVLKPDSLFAVIFSNRMFPTKAVRIWCALPDAHRMELVKTYFHHAGGYVGIASRDISPNPGTSDPVYVVAAHKVNG
jgi:SAM-dependent methyltransferase